MLKSPYAAILKEPGYAEFCDRLACFHHAFSFHKKTALRLVFITAQSSGGTCCKIINLLCEKECDRQQSLYFIFSERTLDFIGKTPQIMY